MTRETGAPQSGVQLSLRFLRSEVSSIASAGVLVQLLMVVSGPLMARMLGPDGRGHLFMVMVVAGIGAQFGSAALSSAISHAVATGGGVAKDVLGSNLRFWTMWSLLPAALSAAAAVWLLRGAPNLPWLTLGTFAVTLFACWLSLLSGMLYGEGSTSQINRQRVVFAAVYVSIVVAFFVLYPSDAAALLLIPFLAAQVVGLVLGWRALKEPTSTDARPVGRSVIHRFARTAWVSRVGSVDSLSLDALIVGIFLAPAEVGLYAVAVSVTTLPGMALGDVATALLPRMAAAGPSESIALMRRWLAGALVIAVTLVVGLELIIAPAIDIFFGDDFVPAVDCARILIVARAFLAMRMVLAAAAQAQGNAARTSTIELVATGFLIVTALVAVPQWGIEGAALALLLTSLLSCACLSMSLSWRRTPTTVAG